VLNREKEKKKEARNSNEAGGGGICGKSFVSADSTSKGSFSVTKLTGQGHDLHVDRIGGTRGNQFGGGGRQPNHS